MTQSDPASRLESSTVAGDESATTSALLEVNDLCAGYGPVAVLHHIDMTVMPGEVVVILGANGAGKTTTMSAISGMMPRTGSVTFDGKSIERSSAEAIVRLGIAQVPEGRGTFAALSVEDNLRLGAYVRPDLDVDEEIERWYEKFPVLAERRRQQAGSLSGGEQQMLAISRALMSRPRLLLCDEPSQGLAPLITQELFRTLARLSEEDGIAVLLVEQNANLAMEFAHRIYLLETGHVVASGDTATLSADDSIRKAYLGY